MRYTIILVLFFSAQSMAEAIMTNMSLSYIPGVDETKCKFERKRSINPIGSLGV